MLHLEEKQQEEALIVVVCMRESTETTSEWLEVTKYSECNYLLTQKQTKQPINSASHSFHSVLMKEAVKLNSKLGVVHIPLIF